MILLAAGGGLYARMAGAAPPGPIQSGALVQSTAETFVRRETAHLGGTVVVTVSPPDARLRLAACEQLEAFAPPGSRLSGRTTVGVRCNAPAHWQVLLPANVQITATYFVAAHTLQGGHPISLEDLLPRQGDIGQLGVDVITDPDQAIGLLVAGGIAAGQALRAEMLKQPSVVHQGQGVMLEVNGAGFRVTAEGVALNDAAAGQTAQVRTLNGQVVRGLARSGGIVEIAQ
jgi:flagellar basal body P-ring formation protein FlgA